MVQKLKLNFAIPDDYDRIIKFFLSERKKLADPEGYIYKRKGEYLRNSLSTRSAAFLTDISTDEIVYFTSTYRLYDGEINTDNQHVYTEAGSSISIIPGYGSTTFVASLLLLKEWLFHPPKKHIVSRIKQGNKAALMSRSKTMGWNIVQDEDLIEELWAYCNKSRPDDAEDITEGMLWFYMHGNHIIQKEANLALRVMDRGALINKDEEIMPIDFSVINEIGITIKKLKAMARGETCREKLLDI